MEIKHPEWLQVDIDTQFFYGYSQEWYPTSYQRTRGCGPTAAAMLLVYLNKRAKGRLSYYDDTIPSITGVLNHVWRFITPGRFLGLNSTSKFSKGMETLLRYHGLNWSCRRLPVSAVRFNRVSLDEVIHFLEAGISSDCPIAFLNLQRGQVAEMESWHWTVIISVFFDAKQKRYMAVSYDGGKAITFDIGLWLESTVFGGGFVYIAVPE